MHPALGRNQFFVKEHVGLLKAANEYDLLDPVSGVTVLECREPDLDLLTQALRFALGLSRYKSATPLDVQVRTPQGHKVLTVRRGYSIGLTPVDVLDEHDRLIGRFKPRLFSIGGKFDVVDAFGQPVCSIKGKWAGPDFRVMRGDTELARVFKKWAGLGKELFTSADDYMLTVNDQVGPDNQARILIVAAVLCVDMLFHE